MDPDLPRPVIQNGRFQMPWEFLRPSFFSFMKSMFSEKNASNVPCKVEDLDEVLPVHSLVSEEVKNPPTDEKLRVTWLGHATVMVQMSGISILTDPVFSDRLGPSILRYLPGSPKRYRRCPCTVQELPEIDAVVISHNHYDHLDYESVLDLNKRFGAQLAWFVPSGMKSWMLESGVENVKELSWWDDEQVTLRGKNFKFSFVPAVHWCRRGANDVNKVLWGGWCVSGPRNKFYFAGDTAYNENIFKLIGKKYGPFDLSAIPIGAYCPRSFMKHHHIDPNEAFKIHKEVGSYNTLGIHWGTFVLTYEFYLEPRDKIISLQGAETLETGRLGFFTENHGVSRLLNARPTSDN